MKPRQHPKTRNVLIWLPSERVTPQRFALLKSFSKGTFLLWLPGQCSLYYFNWKIRKIKKRHMTTLSHDLVSNQRWRHIKVTAGHQENQLTGQTQASPNTFFQMHRVRIRYQGLIQICPEAMRGTACSIRVQPEASEWSKPKPPELNGDPTEEPTE